VVVMNGVGLTCWFGVENGIFPVDLER